MWRLLKECAETSLTLNEICDAVVSDGHGRSTVYRLISELVEEGKVRRISDGRTRHCTYQYIGDEHCKGHLHLKCKSCGRLIHMDEGATEELCRRVLDVGGFRLDVGELFFGRCGECSVATEGMTV